MIFDKKRIIKVKVLFIIQFFDEINFFIVSNEIPDVPVISPSSGAIFERRLIEKYLQENGVDPISGKDMTVEELIEIKSLYYFKILVIS